MNVSAQTIMRLIEGSIATALAQDNGDPYLQGRLDALEDLKDQIQNGAVL